MRKLVLFLFIICIISAAALTAQSNNYSKAITFAPSCSFQRILYEVPQYYDKNGFGLGVLVSYDRFRTDSSSLGLQLSAETEAVLVVILRNFIKKALE